MEDLVKIFIQVKKRVKNIPVISWRERKSKKSEPLENVIKQLRSKKETFKVVSSKGEKTYSFNGNNYVIS